MAGYGNPKLPAKLVREAWGFLRRVTGDDAYERYLGHWQAHHAHRGPSLDRKAFHAAELQRRWSGIKRCC